MITQKKAHGRFAIARFPGATASLIFAALVATPTVAHAGGNEFPGNGTEALGRGAAFTAKASDATAFDYNVAGFAQQRGTRLLFDSNLIWNDYSFQRSGADPNNNGAPYAKVQNTGGIFFAPYIGVSTDFGKLDRWTFAAGVFGPSSVGNRTFPASVGGIPAPNRYDITKTNLLLFFPTLAAAYRVTHWLDVGAQVMLAYGTFDLSNVSNVPVSSTLCKGNEYAPCDTGTRIQTSGITATAAIGAMVHVKRFLDIGVHVRGPVNLNTSGTVTATTAANAPGVLNMPIQPAPGTFTTHLPWIVRLGVRYIFRSKRDHNFENGDIELDGDYEAWKAAEGDGDSVFIPALSLFSNISPDITHHYQDTFSARVGGAYNLKLPAGVLTFRLGAYFDSAATKYADTRLDFDTMAKYAGTGGLGYKVRGIALNVAYAYIYEPDRNVTDGDIRLINGIDGTQKEPNGQPTPVVNNGLYKARNQILSIGLTVTWDELLARRRVIVWE
jgi:long-subunit fatty acid transport protein